MSKIIESTKITDLLDHIDQDTLVLLDLDNTLIEPTASIGGSVFFIKTYEKLVKRGLSKDEAMESVYAVWRQLQHMINVRTVEKDTKKVVDDIQNMGIKVMGLTGRGFIIAEPTIKLLDSVGIRLDKNTIHHERVKLSELNGFFEGVLFSRPDGNKGRSLVEFFDKIKYEYRDKKLLFVDDEHNYINGFVDYMENAKVNFKCIRYGAADKNHEHFDPAVAEKELKTLFAGTEHEYLLKNIF